MPQTQETSDLLEQQQVAGAGAQPLQYLRADAYVPDVTPAVDSAAISSTSTTVGGLGASPAPLTPPDDQPQYIVNTPDNPRTIASHQKDATPSITVPTATSPAGDAINQANSLQQGLDDDTTSFLEQNYSTTNSDGYLVPDSAKLEEWAKSVLSRANILFSLLLAMTNMVDLKKIVEQAFTEVPISPDGKYSYKKIFAQKFQSYQKIVQTAVASLLSYVNTKNNELYQKRLDDIKAKDSGTWSKIHNFCDSGQEDTKVTEESLKEGRRYLQATKDTVKEMQAVLDDIAEYMKSLAGDGRGSVFALGMYGFIKGFNDQVGEINKTVDDKLAEIDKALSQIDDQGGGFFGGIGDFCGDLFEGNWDNLGGDLKEIGHSLKQLGSDIIHGNWKGICTWAGNELNVIKGWNDALWRGVFGDDVGGFMANFTDLGFDLGQTGLAIAKDPFGAACKLVKLVLFKLVGYLVGKVILSYIFGGIAAGVTWLFDHDAGKKVWHAMGTAGDKTYEADQIAGKYVFDKGIIKGLAWFNKHVLSKLSFGSGAFQIISAYVVYLLMEGFFPLAALVYLSMLQVQEPANLSGDDFMKLDIDGLLKKYRGGLTGMENGYRMLLALEMMPRDLRDTVRQKLTGLNNVESDAEIIMASAESAMSLASSFVDLTASEMMLKAGLYNQTVQLEHQYIRMCEAQEMYALRTLCTVAAIVIGIIVSIISLGSTTVPYTLAAIGAIAGMTAGMAGAEGDMIANDVPSYDAISPDQGLADVDTSGSVGAAARDPFIILDREIETNERLAAKAQTFYAKNKDGFYSFDAKAFAAFELRETMIGNAIRSVFSILKGGRDLVRVVDAELSGSATIDSGDALLQNAVSNLLGEKSVELSAIKYMHQQVIAAKNLARQSELAEEKAMGMMASSVGGALAGAALGACISPAGVFIGMGLGSALASSAYNFLWLEFSPDSALGASFESKDQELAALLRKQGGNTAEAMLDKAEVDAYEDLLANGIVSTGDGYSGVNFPLVTSVYAKIGSIYTAKEVLSKARSLASELRSIVKQELGGAIDPTVGDLTESVNRASFGTAMKVVQNIVAYSQARVQVMNRARDAQKQALLAGIGFGINAALSAVGFSCLSVAPAVSAVASAAMGLSNSLISLISHLTAMEQGDGAYSHYDAKTTVDKTGRRSKNAPDIDGKLDDLEAEIMAEMNTSLIGNIGGSMQGVSPQASVLSWRLKAIYNIKECISIARSSASSCKTIVGGKGSSDYGRSFIEQYQSLALSMLDSMKQSLETIAQRHNQISEEEKAAILSGIAAGFSALSFAASVAGACAGTEVPNDKGTAVKTTNPASAGPTTAAAETTPATSEAPAQSSTPSSAPDSQGTPKADVPPANNSKTKINPDAKEAATWRRVGEWLNMAATITNLLVDTIYDAAAYSKGHKASSPQAGKSLDPHQRAQSGKADSGKSTAGAQEGGNIYTSLDNMDFETAIAEQNISIFESNDQAKAYAAARSARLLEAVQTTLRQLSSLLDSCRTPKEAIPAVSPKDEAAKIAAAMMNKKPETLATMMLAQEKKEPQSMVKLMAADKDTLAMAVKARDALALTDPNRAALSALINTVPQQRSTQATFKQTDTNNTPNTKGLMDRAEQIGKQNQAKNEIADKYVKAETNVKNEVKNLNEDYKAIVAKTGEMADEVEALKEKLQTAKPEDIKNIKDKIEELEAQKNNLQLKLGKLTAELQKAKGELDAVKASKPTTLNSIKAEKAAYKKELAEVTQKIEEAQSGTPEQQATLPALQAKVKTLQAEIGMCEAALEQVDDPKPIKDAENGINQLKEQIKEIRGKISEIGTKINKLQGQLLSLEKGETKGDNKRTVKAGSVVTSGQKAESQTILEVLGAGSQGGGEGQSQDGGNSGSGGQNNGKNGKQGGKQSFLSLLFGDTSSAPVAPKIARIDTGSQLGRSFQQKYHDSVEGEKIFSGKP
jgi:hypothetical protein